MSLTVYLARQLCAASLIDIEPMPLVKALLLHHCPDSWCHLSKIKQTKCRRVNTSGKEMQQKVQKRVALNLFWCKGKLSNGDTYYKENLGGEFS